MSAFLLLGSNARDRRKVAVHHRRGWRLTAALLTLALATTAGAALAGPNQPPADWHTVKCERYRTAWTAALARFGTDGLSRPFLERSAAFLASNCTRPADVCPRSAAEFKLANIMVILSMNAGTASTFPPFACPGLTAPAASAAPANR